MALFLSTFTNKVDKKGRVSVPASFRAVLSGQHFPGIVAFGSFVHPCVEACSMERLERLSESIDHLDPYSEARDAFATTILGEAMQLAFDKEGRVLLPTELLEKAGITDQAVFVGKGQTFEIWNPGRFAEYSARAREVAKNERANLRLSPKGGVQ
ncbi:MAG: division/cell wall cluster transcriptional repressor MraZ [Rickettsiales bacterium]|nr:division/cell wall cluster transcriptional repressor MraZ [Rickettsiales bacterium]